MNCCCECKHGYCQCDTCLEFHGECQECAEENRLDEIIAHWNWNYSPAECAQDMIEQDLRAYEVRAAMERAGHRDEDIEAVLDVFEVFA